jgi:hypothetical protein
MATYDRFWDLHVTAPNGWYDFAGSIGEQERYQKAKHSGHLPESMNLVWPSTPPAATNIASCSLMIGQRLPTKGYVCSAVTTSELQACKTNEDFATLARWIGDGAHEGKLRINCHGDGMGHIGMADGAASTATMSWIDPAAVGEWLFQNGLGAGGTGGTKRAAGLMTVSVAVCMAARYGTTPATLNATATSSEAAPNSAVARVVQGLRQRGIFGVEVTGSNEITMMAGRDQYAYVDDFGKTQTGQGGQLHRVLGMGAQQLPQGGGWIDFNSSRETGINVPIPTGWKVAPYLRGTYALTIPLTFMRIDPIPKNGSRNPSGGWEIKSASATVSVPEGWIVDVPKRLLVTPLGWTYSPPTTSGNEGYLVNRSLTQGRFEERLAHSPLKVREIT